jgi:hypothetical protein
MIIFPTKMLSIRNSSNDYLPGENVIDLGTLETTNNISIVISNVNNDDDETGVLTNVFEIVLNKLGSDTLVPNSLLLADADLVEHLSSINILLRTKPPKPSDMWYRGGKKSLPRSPIIVRRRLDAPTPV